MWFLKHTVVEVKNPTMVFKKTCWFQDGLVWDNKFVVFCTHYNLETNAVHSFHIHWKSELVHQTSGDQSFTKKTLDAKDILKIYCVEITSQGESTTLTKRRPAVHPFLHMKQPLDTQKAFDKVKWKYTQGPGKGVQSLSLFSICTEPLATAICQNTNMKWTSLLNTNHKLSYIQMIYYFIYKIQYWEKRNDLSH